MKISGADFVAWQNSDWGHRDAFGDDYTLVINGVEVDDYDPKEVKPNDQIEIHGGVVFLGAGKELSATAHFKQWKKAQTHENIAFSVPKETVAAFVTAAEGFGAKVLK